MVNQKAMFAIVAIVATLSVAAIVRAIMSTTMAKSDQFSITGNLYDSPGAGDGNHTEIPKQGIFFFNKLGICKIMISN
jgi:hypothetical protein